jgi:EmrB/QacA subfamily drug resistance transporter
MSQQGSKNLILAAMIFAVAMMFIDQTIVAIAIPQIEHDISLSATGGQWIINGYLLSLSALFAFGGKLSDVLGHRRMVLVGVVGFALFSALCGATPSGSFGEAWLIAFRVLQGAAAAVMFPAALAIVVASFDIRERGKALAIFFAVTGGLTSIGPIAGGFLVEWTWRAIFWINVPVAIIALILTFLAKPSEHRVPTKIDYRGTVLVCAGMGLTVLGLQQASVWGWGSLPTWACIVVGVGLILTFIRFELRVPVPLLQLRIFADRGFAADNVVLFLLCIVFVPLFFFASTYSQISLGYNASNAGLYLLIFFGGFAFASQFGGRLLDARGAKIPVVAGCAVAAVGFFLWASKLTDLSLDSQWIYIVLSGIGIGLILSPVSTDALNRAPADAYGEVTGITQTVRYFGSSLGLAVMGTILIQQNTSNLEKTLGAAGIPTARADAIAHALTRSGGDAASFSKVAGSRAQEIFAAVQHDYAQASRTVFYIMAAVMAVAFVVSLATMPKGLSPQALAARGDQPAAPEAPTPGAAV